MNEPLVRKRCRDCDQSLPLSRFWIARIRGRGYPRPYCKDCHVARAKRNREKVRVDMKKVKADLACWSCGWDEDPDLLQWDHIDPATKRGNVSDFVHSGSSVRAARERLLTRPLCPMCHAKRTKEQRQAARDLMTTTPSRSRGDRQPGLFGDDE